MAELTRPAARTALGARLAHAMRALPWAQLPRRLLAEPTMAGPTPTLAEWTQAGPTLARRVRLRVRMTARLAPVQARPTRPARVPALRAQLPTWMEPVLPTALLVAGPMRLVAGPMRLVAGPMRLVAGPMRQVSAACHAWQRQPVRRG